MNHRALLFSHRETTFMLPAELCREVFPPHSLLPLPAARTVLLGLTEVRGRAVPLIDLSALYGPGAGAAPPHPSRSALGLLIELQGELLALPVEQMLGVCAVETLPDAPDTVFEATRAQGRDVQYIHASALLGTLQLRAFQT